PFNITVATVIAQRSRKWYLTLMIVCVMTAIGIALGMAFGMHYDVLLGTAYGLITTMWYGILFGMRYFIAGRSSSAITAGVASALGSSAFYVAVSMMDPEHS